VIAAGLAIELIAATMVVTGLGLGPSGSPLLWSSMGAALIGLAVAVVGVRRARPPRSGWTPPRAVAEVDPAG
jgi:hypothetical protein